jgi:hypothetical protein
MSHQQATRQNYYVKKANKSFVNVKFPYLGMMQTNQNCMHTKIKGRLISGNVCYYKVQNLLSSCLLYKNIMIKLHKTTIYPSFYTGMNLVSWIKGIIQKEFKNMVLRGKPGPKRMK